MTTNGSLDFDLLHCQITVKILRMATSIFQAYLHSLFIVLCVHLSAIQARVHVFVILVFFCDSSVFGLK